MREKKKSDRFFSLLRDVTRLLQTRTYATSPEEACGGQERPAGEIEKVVRTLQPPERLSHEWVDVGSRALLDAPPGFGPSSILPTIH